MSTTEVRNTIAGDVLVILAQIIVSVQMVLEQKLLSGVNVPALLAVGLEGLQLFLHSVLD